MLRSVPVFRTAISDVSDVMEILMFRTATVLKSHPTLMGNLRVNGHNCFIQIGHSAQSDLF